MSANEKLDLDAIEARAKAAHGAPRNMDRLSYRQFVIDVANPETVLALVARVRELEAEVEAQKRVIDYARERRVEVEGARAESLVKVKGLTEQRDAAIARAEQAERERDEARANCTCSTTLPLPLSVCCTSWTTKRARVPMTWTLRWPAGVSSRRGGARSERRVSGARRSHRRPSQEVPPCSPGRHCRKEHGHQDEHDFGPRHVDTIAELRAKLAEVTAQAAAMREALETRGQHREEGRGVDRCEFLVAQRELSKGYRLSEVDADECDCGLYAALAPDAGRALLAELAALRESVGRVQAWTHEMGAALKPHGADSYGEGIRDAKAQVARLLEVTRA